MIAAVLFELILIYNVICNITYYYLNLHQGSYDLFLSPAFSFFYIVLDESSVEWV